MIPPTAIAVVSRPKPTSFMPSRSLAYSTSTDHAAPKVTLKVRIVRAKVRIGACARSHRTPSTRSALRPVLAAAWARVLEATRDTSSAPRANAAAFVANGSAMPIANRNAPIGGATSWLVSTNALCILAFAMPRSSRATRLGRSVLLAESANVSAVPMANRATRTTAMLTAPVMIVATSSASTSARPRFTMTTSRRRSNRSAAAPPRTPNSSAGRYSLRSAIETRNGSRVWDATSSGPGGDRDAVAGVVDEGRGQQPSKVAAESRGNDEPGQAIRDREHARQRTNSTGVADVRRHAGAIRRAMPFAHRTPTGLIIALDRTPRAARRQS